MPDIETVIIDLIKEVIEEEVRVPSDEDIRNTAESVVESHLEEKLLDEVLRVISTGSSIRRLLIEIMRESMDIDQVAREKDLEDLRTDLQREIEVRSLKFKVRSLGQRIKSWFSWACTGRAKNARKVLIWTLLV